MVQFFVPAVVRRVASAFAEEGGRALIVGGLVRDALLGKANKDFDFEVYGLEVERVEKVLARLGRVNLAGRAFGVWKVTLEGVDFDVSLPRRESKVGAGHKGFVVTGDPFMSVREAARRRDLTINSMAWDPLTGELHDPFGGRADLERGILRATDPTKFGEDPLRVYRLAQFAARFGFSVDPVTLELARSLRDELPALAMERVGTEWRKLLVKGVCPGWGLQVLELAGVLEVMHPQLHALVGLEQDAEWHPEGDVFRHTCFTLDAAAEILRREGIEDRLSVLLAALLHDVGKAVTTRVINGRIRSPGHAEAGVEIARSFLRPLGFGKAVERKVLVLVKEHLAHLNATTDRAIRRLALRLDPATIAELAVVIEADHSGRLPLPPTNPAADLVRRARELAVEAGRPKPLLMGRDLIRLGFKPGPEMGRVLRAVFEAQVVGEVATKEQALAMAEEIAND